MSSNIQYKILRKCFAVIFFFVKFSGIWIYKIDHRNHRKIEYNFRRIVYSISFFCSMLVGYLAAGREFVYSVNRKLFVSFAFQSVFRLHTDIIMISSISLYTVHYLQYDIRKIAYEKCSEVIDLLKSYQWNIEVDVRKYLVLFFIKTVVIDVITFTTIYTNWRVTVGGISISQLYLLAFTFLPVIVVRFYTNLFYGGTLCIKTIFQQLNKSLSDVLFDAKLFNLKMNVGNYQSMQKVSRLCNDLDKLSIFHLKLVRATEAFNSVFSFQIVLSIISLVLVLVMRCFYEYVAIVEFLTKNSTASLYRSIFMIFTMYMSVYDLYSTSNACESLEKQVCTYIR